MSEFSSRTSASSIADLLNEITSQASPPVLKMKPKIQAKDYSRENILRVRQLSAARKNEKQQEMNQFNSSTKDAWFRLLPDKYTHVPAKVSTLSPKLKQTSETKKISVVPSLNLENTNPKPKQNVNLPRPPSVPKLQLSYVKENANSAKYTRLKRCNSASDLDTKQISNHQPGFVPKYLIERKKQLILEKEKEAEMENYRINHPEGHLLMPDKDRLETLKLMKEKEDELIQRLSSLPVCLGTLRLRKEKEQIDQQLAKLDEGIKIFSRSKVYIKNDDE